MHDPGQAVIDHRQLACAAANSKAEQVRDHQDSKPGERVDRGEHDGLRPQCRLSIALC
jgi:hypothetical protein